MMLDYVDGDPLQAPQESQAYGFLTSVPSVGAVIGATAGEESVSDLIARQNERRAAAEPGVPFFGGNRGEVSPPAPIPKEQMQSAEQINKQYAPIGPDGKPVSITNDPMLPSVAKLVAKAKADQLDREGVISRWGNAHGMLTNFAVGMAGFIQDPLNAASMFVPGLGEETSLAAATRLGLGGIAARTGARVIAGATAGASGQAPLTALKYGLGTQEASDYDLRSAFKDLAFGAAGGAIMHAGVIGGLRETGFLRPDEMMKAAALPAPEVKPPEAEPGALETPARTEEPVPAETPGEPIYKVNFPDWYHEQAAPVLYGAEDLETFRDRYANIIGQEAFYSPARGMVDNEILKSLDTLPERLKDVNERLKTPDLPPDWRNVLEDYRQRIRSLADKWESLREQRDNRVKLAAWAGDITKEEADSIINADAVTKEAAMKSAVAQLLSGREIDTAAFFRKDAPIDIKQMSEKAGADNREGSQPGMTSLQLEQATKEIFPDKKADKIQKEKKASKALTVPKPEAAVKETPVESAVLTPEHAELEKRFGVPEKMTRGQLTKADNILGKEFAEQAKNPTYSDAQYNAMEEFTRRIETARENLPQSGVKTIDERQPVIDALEANLDKTSLPHDELDVLNAYSTADAEARSLLEQKRNALTSCLIKNGG